MSHPHLPKFWFRLLQWFCREELFEELQGDLEEAFEENIESVGLQRARRIYRLEVLKLFRFSVIKKPAGAGFFGCNKQTEKGLRKEN